MELKSEDTEEMLRALPHYWSPFPGPKITLQRQWVWKLGKHKKGTRNTSSKYEKFNSSQPYPEREAHSKQTWSHLYLNTHSTS